MDILNEIVLRIGSFFLQPMFYLGVIILILQYRRQISFERKLFSSRIHSWPVEVFRSLGYGLLGGIIASILMILLGVVFNPQYLWLIWLVTMMLLLFNVRFLCLSYSIGIVGFISGIMQLFDQDIMLKMVDLNYDWLKDLIVMILNIDIPTLIAIVAVLHLVEAILVKFQSAKQATPIFVESKRGRLIGGFQIQSYWLLPLFIFVPSGNFDQNVLFTLSWWPLFSQGMLTIIPVPAMIGYADFTTVYTPKEKTGKSFKYLLIYSLVLLGLAFIASKVQGFQIIAAIFSGFGHELIRVLGNRQEIKLPAKYVHPRDGLKVLAVIPGSLADLMKIETGEVIKKVNGIPIANKQELYDALQKQSAFVKLEIINLEGQIRFAQHSIYTGEHHQLGIILSPDDDAPYYIELEDINLFKLLKQKLNRVARGA